MKVVKFSFLTRAPRLSYAEESTISAEHTYIYVCEALIVQFQATSTYQNHVKNVL